MSIRDALSAPAESTIIDVNGARIEVRPLAVGKLLKERPANDQSDTALEAMCNSLFDPETGEQVFRWPHDKNVLRDMPFSRFRELQNAVNEVNGFTGVDHKGNSQTTPTTSSGADATG